GNPAVSYCSKEHITKGGHRMWRDNFPYSLFHPVIGFSELSCQRQCQGDGMISYFVNTIVGNITHRDGLLFRSLKINIVHTDTISHNLFTFMQMCYYLGCYRGPLNK